MCIYILETQYLEYRTGETKELVREDQRKRVIKNGVVGEIQAARKGNWRRQARIDRMTTCFPCSNIKVSKLHFVVPQPYIKFL
jgi:hypothetical protein